MGRLLIIAIVIAAGAGAFYYMRLSPQPATGPTKAAQSDPYALGEAHFAKSEYGLAVAEFQRGLANNLGDPRAPPARFWIGKSYENLKQPNDALKAYEEFVVAFPQHELTVQAKTRIEFLTGTGASRIGRVTTPVDYNNLGHPSTVPVGRPLRPGWPERHAQYCARAKQGGVDLLFIGDSLTQRWEGAPGVQKFYGRRCAAQMGIDNDGTQQLLWRIDHGTMDGVSPKVVVLLIGINNIGNEHATPGDVRDGVAAVIGRIQQKASDAKVLLLGVLPYDLPNVDYDAAIAGTNRELPKLADNRRVFFLDVGACLLIDGRVHPDHQPDGAHMSPKGYALLAAAIEPKLRELLGEA